MRPGGRRVFVPAARAVSYACLVRHGTCPDDQRALAPGPFFMRDSLLVRFVNYASVSLLHAAPIANLHWHRGFFVRDYRRQSQHADTDSVLLTPPQS
jgi:hypothetical protein